MGDNLITKSPNMTWWEGIDVEDYDLTGKKFHVDHLLNVFNDMVSKPERKPDADMRLPISGVYKIKGVGDVLAGRVEQAWAYTRPLLSSTYDAVLVTPPRVPLSNRLGGNHAPNVSHKMCLS